MAIPNSVILQTDTLNLPDMFTARLRSKKVEISASEQVIIIKPYKSSLLDAPKLKSDGHEVDRFMERKQQEKRLEYGG